MTTTFSFPTTILFGPGSVRELKDRLSGLHIQRPMIVTDPGIAKTDLLARAKAAAGSTCETFSEVTANPIPTDVQGAADLAKKGRCDGIIALGGGSALDVGKIARVKIAHPDLDWTDFSSELILAPLIPFIAIPTTAGTGSEVGRSSVLTLGQTKKVFFHPRLLADLVILDAELTVGLPPSLTAATGADALTHCIEAFTVPVFHPMCDGIALEGIRLINEALPRAVKNGHDLEARGHMLIAASMGAVAFQKDLRRVHSLAHPLSALCHIHHGLANALCLPAVMEFNAKRKSGLYQRIGQAMGLQSTGGDVAVIKRVRSLLKEIGIPPGLRGQGVKEDQLPQLADHAFADSCHRTNPVPVTRDDLLALYHSSM